MFLTQFISSHAVAGDYGCTRNMKLAAVIAEVGTYVNGTLCAYDPATEEDGHRHIYFEIIEAHTGQLYFFNHEEPFHFLRKPYEITKIVQNLANFSTTNGVDFLLGRPGSFRQNESLIMHSTIFEVDFDGLLKAESEANLLSVSGLQFLR